MAHHIARMHRIAARFLVALQRRLREWSCTRRTC